MNTNDLIKVVESALSQLLKLFPIKKEEELSLEIQEALLEHELSSEIEKVLSQQEEFIQPLMINTINGACGFDRKFVALLLLREAKKRGSATAAVTWLQKILNTQKGTGIVVCTMWGITIEDSFELPGGVRLIPFNRLPSSRHKDAFIKNFHTIHHSQLVIPAFMCQPPTSALTLEVEVNPFFCRADEEKNINSVLKYHQLFNDIQLCMISSNLILIIRGPEWFQYADQDLDDALICSSKLQRYSEVTPIELNDHKEFDFHRASEFLKDFNRCQSKAQNKLRTAMDRLSQSMLRRSPADKALELAIALETLLVDYPGEHTFKISLRAALLANKVKEDRIRIRAVIAAMYNIRSTLMHTGTAKEKYTVRGFGSLPAEKIIEEATIITSQVIQNIVSQGDTPDWNSIELSNL